MFVDDFGLLSWIYGKMDKKRKIWAIAGVLRSGEETPRSGEGPCSGEGSPSRSEAEREGWPSLGFSTAKLFVVAKLLFITQNLCVLFIIFLLLQGLVYLTNEDPISV